MRIMLSPLKKKWMRRENNFGVHHSHNLETRVNGPLHVWDVIKQSITIKDCIYQIYYRKCGDEYAKLKQVDATEWIDTNVC